MVRGRRRGVEGFVFWVWVCRVVICYWGVRRVLVGVDLGVCSSIFSFVRSLGLRRGL